MKLRWMAVIGVGLAAVGLGVWWLLEGLERADQLASVLGAFAGLTGTGLAVWGIHTGRRSPGPQSASGGSATSGQSVTGSYVGGNVTQVGGDIRGEGD